MGTDANEEREESHDAKANSHVGQVIRAGPLYAKMAILLLTAVADALGEIAAFEGRVDVLPISIWVGYPHHLTLATAHKAIVDNEPGVEELSSRIDEPEIRGFIRWSRLSKKTMGYQSVREIARMFLNGVVVVIDATWRERQGLTRVRLAETRRKVTT